jgi:hypothetical protein
MNITNEKKCVYFAVLIVLVLIILLLTMRWAKKGASDASSTSEKMQNVGYPYAFGASSFNQGYAWYPQSGMSSGAYMRNLSQEMSQPLQGEYTSPSAMRVKGVEDFVWPEPNYGYITSPGVAQLAADERSGTPPPSLPERLVGSRGEPDFWELPQELRSAQVRQAGARLSSGNHEKFLVGGTNTRAANDIDAYVYPHVY